MPGQEAKAKAWSQCSVVKVPPGKVSGTWVLKDTRMPVSAIFENLEAGANIDDIMEWFASLDRSEVEAAIEFVARSPRQAPFVRSLTKRVLFDQGTPSHKTIPARA